LVRGPQSVYLITNRHVVRGRRQDNDEPLHPSLACPDTLVIQQNLANVLGSWTEKREALYEADGTPRWLEHPTYDGMVDVAAVPLTDLSNVAIYDYDINAPKQIAVGPSEVVSIIGFPFGRSAGGLLGIWVAGTIASEPELDFQGLPSFLIDSRTREGQSGSPVLAYRTGPYSSGGALIVTGGPVEELLGVYSGRLSKESDLGVVWKVAAIQAIVAGNRRPYPPT
jgi:hypothetical protein